MMIFKQKIKFLAITICLFLFSSLNVSAGSATLNLTGSSSVIINNEISITLNINNINAEGGIAGVQAKLHYDSEYLTFVSATNLAKFGISYSDSVKTMSGASFGSDNITSTSSGLMKFTFKAKKEGKTDISITNVEVSEGNGAIANVGGTSKSIIITPPPSTNANLSNLTISPGTINFNKNTTSYNIDVDSNITSIIVNASAEDAGAKVSGTGTKNLNYGKNTINVVVTAPSGDKKAYTLTVNRKDDRSTNNNLSSLSVSGYTISPKFNSGTTSYSMEVPFEVSAININATAQDPKAKVTIGSNQKKLTAGKNNAIKITVTAENGATKTYTLNVKRAPDPNKVLSTNNDLASLSIKDVPISPVFNKDVTAYTANVSYEIESVEFIYAAADKEYGSVKLDGPETLKAGENKYTLTVSAEDSSTKEYTVIITKEKNPDGSDDIPVDKPVEPIPEKELVLKELNLKNGKLVGKFDQNVFVYQYKKDKNFTFDAIPKNSEDTVTIFENSGVYTILIEDSEGNQSVYTLIPKNSNIMIIIISCVSILFISGGTFLGYKLGLKKDKPQKTPKMKKTTKKESLAN